MGVEEKDGLLHRNENLMGSSELDFFGAKQAASEAAPNEENYNDEFVQDMVANPLVGDLDSLVSTQNITSFTSGHKKRQDRFMTIFDDYFLENLMRSLFYK